MGDWCSPIPRVISGFHSVALEWLKLWNVGLLCRGFVKGHVLVRGMSCAYHDPFQMSLGPLFSY